MQASYPYYYIMRTFSIIDSPDTNEIKEDEMIWVYEVCSNSIRIGIVVVVHWVGCVCNQS